MEVGRYTKVHKQIMRLDQFGNVKAAKLGLAFFRVLALNRWMKVLIWSRLNGQIALECPIFRADGSH
jgi:hypothetical protein